MTEPYLDPDEIRKVADLDRLDPEKLAELQASSASVFDLLVQRTAAIEALDTLGRDVVALVERINENFAKLAHEIDAVRRLER